MNNTILLNSGKYFDYADIESNEIEIQDIAHGLSLTCRFAGQCNMFYSVAEHSYWVSKFVPPILAFQGLMHDASEAFLMDMPKPLKNMMPEYKVIEERLERHIAKQFKFDFPYDHWIKEIDNRMLITEASQVFSQKVDFDSEIWSNVKSLNIELDFWSPHDAENRFMDRYKEVMNA